MSKSGRYPSSQWKRDARADGAEKRVQIITFLKKLAETGQYGFYAIGATPEKPPNKFRHGKHGYCVSPRHLNRLRDTAQRLGFVAANTKIKTFADVKKIFCVVVRDPEEIENLRLILERIAIEFNKVTFEQFVQSRAFLACRPWRTLRKKIIKAVGAQCCKCGDASIAQQTTCHVDHIVPRSVNPSLALEPTNLQVLCETCNREKGVSTADYRTPEQIAAVQLIPQLPDEEKYLY